MNPRVSGELTRRYEGIMEGVEKEFEILNLYYKGDFDLKIMEYKKADSARRREIQAELREMYEMIGIHCEDDQDGQYYMDLYNHTTFPTFSDLENQILVMLYNIYSEFLTPAQYMKNMVERLSSKEELELGETTRLIILRRFIKNCNYAGYNKVAVKRYIRKKTGNERPGKELILKELDDNIFSLLDNGGKNYAEEYSEHDEQNRENHLEILSVSRDLADGNFRTNGKAIEMLYKFAIAFDMKYYSYAEDEYFDYNRDLERNLFENYYNNNLMRYVEDYFIDNNGTLEKEPLGRGINYKNYAELIYLYFLSRNDSTDEKTKKIKQMMSEVKRGINERNRSQQQFDYGSTVFYRNNVQRQGMSESVLDMDEDEFCNYLVENYTWDRENASPFMQARDQNTAYDAFCEIVNNTEVIDREGVWFIDTKEASRKMDELKSILEVSYDETRARKLLQLLEGIDSFLKNSYGKDFDAVNPENVSRTAMITAYYYYFNDKHRFDKWTDHLSFSEAFVKFKEGVDSFLEKAYYQPLSVKNIFDVVVTFSAYSKLVL